MKIDVLYLEVSHCEPQCMTGLTWHEIIDAEISRSTACPGTFTCPGERSLCHMTYIGIGAS